MHKETRKAILKEATELAKKVYCVDEPRNMEKVYTVVDQPSDDVSCVLNGIVPDMADVPPPPYVLERTLRSDKANELFDPEYMWTGESVHSFHRDAGILTGKVVLQHHRVHQRDST